MSTTQHTSHYNLPTFGDNPNDRPSWRGDFTDAMTKIDNQMHTNATNVTTATNTANDAKSTAQSAQSTAQGLQTSIDSVQKTVDSQGSYFNAMGIDSVADAQRFKNLESTVDSQGSYFNAMGIDSVADAQRFKNLGSKVGGHAVWLGDSITEGYLSSGVTFRSMINRSFSYTPHDYWVGGSGWLAQGNSGSDSFPAQATHAIADTTYDHSLVKSVFILGGVNDFPTGSADGSTIQGNVTSTLRSLLDSFPNATIYVGAYIGGELSDEYSISARYKYDEVYRRIIDGAGLVASSRVVCFKCYNWLGVEGRYYNPDGLHPTSAGQQRIYKNLRNIMLGVEVPIVGASNTTGFKLASPDNTIAPKCFVRSIANGDLYYVSIMFDHKIRAADIQSSGKKFDADIVTLPGYIHGEPNLYQSIPFLSNGLGAFSDGDVSGSRYLLLTQAITGNAPIKLHLHIDLPSSGSVFVENANIRVNTQFILPTIGLD